jgi:oligosaccharide repeat unit polymerase
MSLQFAISRKSFFLLMLCSSGLLATCFVSAWFGPRLFEQALYAVGILLAITAALWILKLALDWLSRQDLFAPWIAFPIAYVLWFSLGSIDVFGDPYPPPYGVIGLGLGCYLVGAWLARAMWQRGASVASIAFQDDWSIHRLRMVLSITAIVAMLAYVSIALQVGVPALHSEVGEKRLDLLKTGKSQFVFLCGAWTILVFLATRLWNKNQSRFDKAKIWFALVIASLLLFSLGSRGLLIIPIMTVLVARHYMHQRTRILRFASLALCGFIVASFLGSARDSQSGQGVAAGDVGLDSANFYSLFFYIRNTVITLRDIMSEIPKHVPYQHGYLSFGALSSLLPGHHESSDVLFRRILGLDFIGFGQPATLLGPMYGDFGIAGIVVQMFGLGVFYVWLYFWMLKQPTVLRIVIYAWVCQVVFIALYGSLVTYAISLIVPLGWLVLGKILTRPGRSRGILFAQGTLV